MSPAGRRAQGPRCGTLRLRLRCPVGLLYMHVWRTSRNIWAGWVKQTMKCIGQSAAGRTRSRMRLKMNQDVTPCRTTYTLQQTPGEVSVDGRWMSLLHCFRSTRTLPGRMEAAARTTSAVSAQIQWVQEDTCSQEVGDGEQPHGARLEALLHQNGHQAALVLGLGLCRRSACGPLPILTRSCRCWL